MSFTLPLGTRVIATLMMTSRAAPCPGMVTYNAEGAIDATALAVALKSEHQKLLAPFPDLIPMGNVGLLLHFQPTLTTTYVHGATVEVERALSKAEFATFLQRVIPVVVGFGFQVVAQVLDDSGRVPGDTPLEGTPMPNAAGNGWKH